MEESIVHKNKSSFSTKNIFKFIIKYIFLFITLYLMNFIFEQIIIQLSIKYRVEFFLKNGWNKINLNLCISICSVTFAFLYLLFDILFFVKKNKMLKLCSIFFDMVLLVSAILYFIQIIIAMNRVPGEAGFGFIFFPISIIIFLYAMFSIINKLRNKISSSQAR